ncbi:LysM peptidoglycan-binding domain-containing protein [uncultured Kordia sp.]|uniref:LysM peptidoglycan-binding domain-containing protein n=1 Tax=uncultured Kordia sp. TaxID=507699 RepID=UPI00261C3FF5|nr:LysM peptidoglycan-binding domain-containing protein [uncultured Kordia sp.]
MKPFLKLIFLFSLQLSFYTGFSQTVNASYVVQNGDWLSKISQKAYGNPHLYYKIIESTNEKHLVDKSFQKITNVQKIRVGQKIWIPNYKSSSSTTKKGDVLVAVPITDCEIRIWYNYQVVAISELNKNWIQQKIDLKTRAKKAYTLRHNARVNARFMMADKARVKEFQNRDLKKYGNPDGPTFEQLMEKCSKKGLSTAECYQDVITSSSRVSTVYNNECKD